KYGDANCRSTPPPSPFEGARAWCCGKSRARRGAREPAMRGVLSVRRALRAPEQRSMATRIAAAPRRPRLLRVHEPGAVASREPDEARGSPQCEAYFLYVEHCGRPSNEVWRRELPQHPAALAF